MVVHARWAQYGHSTVTRRRTLWWWHEGPPTGARPPDARGSPRQGRRDRGLASGPLRAQLGARRYHNMLPRRSGAVGGVMASTCLWRSWETRLDWTAYATVPPDVRDRLAAFLAPVCAVIADLAATCPDATDDDLIAVLGTHVLSRPGP